MDLFHEILKKYWNYNSYRGLQLEVIKSIANQKDTVAVLPTGAGKSICYQVPSIATAKKSIIISPLIALMKDQVLNLAKRGIKSKAIYSGLSKYEIGNTLNDFSTNTDLFLFMSPERWQSKEVDNFLQDVNIGFLVIDEAHCISQWGYDFRPQYLRIAEKKELLPQATTIALTATATKVVQEDIVHKLKLYEPNIFKASFQRNNISIHSVDVEGKLSYVCDYFSKQNGSALVYCNARYRTKELTNVLQQHKINAATYNAGMSQEQRNQVQHNWLNNNVPIVVCTNAFGMGIDKPDVRSVIHFDTPESPEAYYQEIGRAGRDGQMSKAYLLFNANDLDKIEDKVNLKFPAVEKIKNIYHWLMQYCGIAYEEGEDIVKEFELDEFCNRYNISRAEAYNCLKILEQNNFIKLSEGVFLPAKVHVTAQLYEINFLEKENSSLYKILQSILRLYGGVLNHYIKINVLKIAEFAQVNTQFVLDSIRSLHQLGYVDFVEAIDKPFVYFMQDRVREYEWRIDIVLYNTLKDRYRDRLQFMEAFATNANDCRMKLLVSYFDEIVEKDCGICDNCINKKIKKIDTLEFDALTKDILKQVAYTSECNISTLKEKLTNKFEILHIDQAISFLLKEKYLVLSPKGELFLA